MLRNPPARIEGEEDKPHRPVVEERDLLMSIGTRRRLGTERAERRRQVERVLVTGEPI
jgi:hypothetical protein